MANTPDGVYARRAWDSNNLPDWSYNRPWASNEERLTTQAISAALIPAEQIRDQVRPPLDMVDPFRPRYGYRTRQLGIDDVIDVALIYAEPRNDYSGGTSGYSGTSRNTQGTGTW